DHPLDPACLPRARHGGDLRVRGERHAGDGGGGVGGGFGASGGSEDLVGKDRRTECSGRMSDVGAGSPVTRDAVLAELTGPGGPFEIVATEIDGVPQRIYANAPRNLREVFLGTRIFGPRDFLVYQDDRWSYEEAHHRVSALAHL